MPAAKTKTVDKANPIELVSSEWVGLLETARILKISPNTVKKLSDRGDILTICLPRSNPKYNRASIMKLLEASTKGKGR